VRDTHLARACAVCTEIRLPPPPRTQRPCPHSASQPCPALPSPAAPPRAWPAGCRRTPTIPLIVTPGSSCASHVPWSTGPFLRTGRSQFRRPRLEGKGAYRTSSHHTYFSQAPCPPPAHRHTSPRPPARARSLAVTKTWPRVRVAAVETILSVVECCGREYPTLTRVRGLSNTAPGLMWVDASGLGGAEARSAEPEQRSNTHMPFVVVADPKPVRFSFGALQKYEDSKEWRRVTRAHYNVASNAGGGAFLLGCAACVLAHPHG
jgi:hypothetical protein